MPKTIVSRKQRLLSALKPDSNKKRLIMFVALFAVIGGGYMTYKSFAATGIGVYGYNNIESYGRGTARVIKQTGSTDAKSGQQVWLLDVNDTVRIKPKPIIWAKYVRVCANVKAVNINAYVRLTVTDNRKSATNGGGSGKGFALNNNGKYQKVCTPYIDHGSAPNEPIIGSAVSTANAQIVIASMSIEYY